MPALVSNEETEKCLRACLTAEGYALSVLRAHGQTGVDTLAKRGDEEVFIEVIGFKQSPPARATGESSRGSIKSFDSGQQLFPGSLKMLVVVPLAKFDPKEIEYINARTEILFISGTIKYDDGFGNNVKTAFGFEYHPPPDDFWTARSGLIKKDN
jgi:hypothetical protein